MSNKEKIQALWNEAEKLVKERKLEKAIDLFMECHQLDETNEIILNTLAATSRILNRTEDASEFLIKSLIINPMQKEIHFNLGLCEQELKHYPRSIQNFSNAIKIDPNYLAAIMERGRSLLHSNKLNLSLRDVQKAITLTNDPSILGELFYLKGTCHHDLKEYTKAINDLEKAIHYREDVRYHLNYYNALSKTSIAREKLIELYKLLAKKYPITTEIYSNLSYEYLNIFDYKNAEEAAKKGLEIEPKNHYAGLNLSQIQLNQGNFSEGWKNYEYRWKVKVRTKKFISTKKPLWNGNLDEKQKVLVWGEQGLGDEILYFSLLKSKKLPPKNTYIVCADKNISLFKRSFPENKIFGFNEVTTDDFFDTHIPVGSLGQHFRPTIESFKNQPEKYLSADDQKTDVLRKKHLNGKKYLCGISWKSKAGSEKSCNIDELLPIFKLNDISFVNLQYGSVSREINSINKKYQIKIGNDTSLDLFNNIDDLASLTDACDFILTTSNITAHIAGGLGKKTYLLTAISIMKFHYWFSNSQQSLWYPSVKIYQQESMGQWEMPINKALDEIKKDFNVH